MYPVVSMTYSETSALCRKRRKERKKTCLVEHPYAHAAIVQYICLFLSKSFCRFANLAWLFKTAIATSVYAMICGIEDGAI